jgi:gamma-glutamyltranspeptidase/glutathione hydrolase
MLNMVERLDVREMGLNSARYIHGLCQIMHLVFADRDFYYGDPYFPPEEPLKGLLSKDYARARLREVNWTRNEPDARPGDPYPFEGKENPFQDLRRGWSNRGRGRWGAEWTPRDEAAFHVGTTSLQAADKSGWVVSMTPSGGWLPPCMAGTTGIAMSQRMQSFVLDPAENPFNVVAPGKRPRATLSPTLALRDGRPFLSFALQGGDSQEQNQLQFFLNVVEFGFNVQEACEGPNFETFQLRASFERHEARPGNLTINQEVPSWVRRELQRMGYRLRTDKRTSGPITAIFFDQENGTLWGGASQHGPDYGLAW